MVARAYGKRADNLLLVFFFIGIVVALVVAPAIIPPRSTDVVSAAAAVGYNTEAAFWTAIIWSMLVILAFAVPGLKRTLAAGATNPPETDTPVGIHENWHPGKPVWGELLAVFLVFTLAYFPFFLARYGPYLEDVYFLSALQRMECGQLPYADFAFLYGPLMIYPLWGWSQVFGSSMASYFGFLSLVEGLQFAILMGILQYFVPDRGKRYWIFLLLLPFLFNTLLGLNYNGMRRLVPALVVILAAYRPYSRAANTVCAVILGLQLAYSHEYAIAALVGIAGIYAVAFLRGERTAALQAGAIIAAGSAIVWAATTVLVLGDSLAAYFGNVAEVVRMMSKGHAGFRFYWTANSLALFGLLTIAIAALGRGLFPARQGDMLSGDRLLVGAILCAVVMLKSGLTRADLWHLNAGFLTLLFAFLLPLPSKAMAIPYVQGKVARGLVIVATVTYLVGIAPTGSMYARSYVHGFIDTVLKHGTTVEAVTRSPSLEFERTEPRPQYVEMGRYLAAPERAGHPVLFYGRAWWVPPLVGVCPGGYKLDDLMYSEFTRSESEYLKLNPDALVVIRLEDYESLYGLREKRTQMELTPFKQLGRWLSTVHYDAAGIETRLKDETREHLTGRYLPLTHKSVAAFGDYVVLAPR